MLKQCAAAELDVKDLKEKTDSDEMARDKVRTELDELEPRIAEARRKLQQTLLPA